MARPKIADPQGRHIRVYVSLLNSPAYRVLGYPAKALFTDLRSLVTATNNGNLSAALSDMKHKGWTSPATLSNALYELRVMGFIAVTRAGGLKMGTRICQLYRFTDLDVFEQPKVGVFAIKATHDYQCFASVGEAERALCEGVKALQAEGKEKQLPKKKSPVHKMKRISTEDVSMEPSINTFPVQGVPSSVHKMNREFSA
jgi:hypothetical protein